MNKDSILITGAGSGIGEATARLFHARGWRVGAYDIDLASVERLAADLGPDCIAGSMDVTDRASVDRAVADFLSHTGGKLNVLCNNAGVFDDVGFEDQTEESLNRIVSININGVMNCARAAFPALRDTDGARLINIGSAASIYGIPKESVYSGSKFFVRGLSEALDLEWRQYGIDVAVIMPSYVATPMVDKADRISWADKFGIKLGADDVANAIWKAAHSKRLYWPMPFENRFLMGLLKMAPLHMVPWLTRKIFFGRGG